ncbi:MAG: hypothetical protein KKH52_01985 [Nanoarchaeota archaeon]|nr:hypothetical protein [Nanoarchaeota archaeon]MBU1622065.1 hypothetical protein [Nanoarchaeota archaeon]MBU1974141.1 hypothetical protein [Nanoarchaeota archaeon]
MNIIKLGGSIVNPDGKYDQKVIAEFIRLASKSKEKFIFVVGGGKLCRKVQAASRGLLRTALRDEEKVKHGHDWLGIAITKINATYVLEKFKQKLGKEVYPEIILDPTRKIKSSARIFFTGGWKPGCSTDKDMMILAETYGAKRICKITNIAYVKKISPLNLAKLSSVQKEKQLKKAAEIKEMSWQQLRNLVGEKWLPGLNTPFDPEAAKIGDRLRKKAVLYIGKKEQFFNMFTGKKFKGTIVRK